MILDEDIHIAGFGIEIIAEPPSQNLKARDTVASAGLSDLVLPMCDLGMHHIILKASRYCRTVFSLQSTDLRMGRDVTR